MDRLLEFLGTVDGIERDEEFFEKIANCFLANGISHVRELVGVQTSTLQFEGQFNAGERGFMTRAIDLATRNSRQPLNGAVASLEAGEVAETAKEICSRQLALIEQIHKKDKKDEVHVDLFDKLKGMSLQFLDGDCQPKGPQVSKMLLKKSQTKILITFFFSFLQHGG